MFPGKTEPCFSQRPADTSADKVLVAVKAEKVISKTALAWAFTHVLQAGDCITLLAVFSNCKTGKRFWHFPRLTKDCRERLPDRICEISESCSQMVLQFHNQVEVGVKIKVVSGTSGRVVAAEAKRRGANWVVLDKKLKQELRHCMEELRCNIVMMKGSQAKVLRLNLGSSDENQTPYYSAAPSPDKNFGGQRMKHSTPVSSPEETGTSYSRTRGGSLSSCESMTPFFLIYEQNPLFEGMSRGKHAPAENQDDFNSSTSAAFSDNRLITLSTHPKSCVASNHKSVFWIPQNHLVDERHPATWNKNYNNTSKSRSQTSRTLLDKFVQFDQDTKDGRIGLNHSPQDYTASSSIRNAVPFGRTSSLPPPLCSLCQHNAPVFGKPPRQFSYKEIEEATEGFSDMNFLARRGFGNVYRGVLRGDQVVAVKLLKSGGSQADADFFREVRVLSCAQHRNVVLLIGFCIDGKKRMLVYEYICNGSLDFHLHGNRRAPLDWHSRVKIAIGTARGLRYLHEDCRVGRIVHSDMRPSNILVTHDFEPLVADFGLARWPSAWNISAEERVIAASGYIAPEYADGRKITEKVDVYAFGVVLLELLTGQRISKLYFFEGRHFLRDWFHPLAALETSHFLTKIYQLLDPCLASEQVYEFNYQLQGMSQAALLCLRPDPESRPAMSKILRILEGGELAIPMGLDSNSVGSRSGHLHGLRLPREYKTARKSVL